MKAFGIYHIWWIMSRTDRYSAFIKLFRIADYMQMDLDAVPMNMAQLFSFDFKPFLLPLYVSTQV